MATSLTFFLSILALCFYLFSRDIVAKPNDSDQVITVDLAKNVWIHLYVEKDQSITVNGQKTDVQHLTKTLTKLTRYTESERKEHLKLILIVDPRISWDIIGEITDAVQEYGVYSMIGHSIMKPYDAQAENDPRMIDYNRALKLPVLEQLQTYENKVTYDLLGKGLSYEDIEESFKQSLQAALKGTIKQTSGQTIKQIDIFEIKKEKLFINGKPTKLENLEAELKQLYGKFSKEQLDNQIVIDVQSYDPEADSAKVKIIRTALSRLGIDQFVWSASGFAHRPNNSGKNDYSHMVSGIPPAGLPNIYLYPENYVEKMHEMNATFFYNGKKIPAERAKTILEENKNTRIMSKFTSHYGINPVMQLRD